MLKLDIKTEPYWIDLPSNVRIRVKPISTAVMSAARALSLADYRLMVDSGELDPANDAQRKGASDSLLIKALARLSIIEWTGVYDAAGVAPAPVSDQNISSLMDIWLVAQDFFNVYVTQISLLETEGNVSAPAANGTSAAEALTAGSAA
ncbi:MAG: hypothetical protein KGI29_09100 [Pseudomonadota bacterium]|nr:hypothetical protein [Pseudomonadota bacterium]MDE3038510.1 hypothetical protein [Pseudomonadota bacterium]